MVLQQICPPALIYVVFSLTQIIFDTVSGAYNTAFIKLWVALLFTILLNYLCNMGLGIISWFIVFIPFILNTVIIALLLLMFGLDPSTGRAIVHKHTAEPAVPIKPADPRAEAARGNGFYDNYNDANVNTVVNANNPVNSNNAVNANNAKMLTQ
jgi:predicted membrane protein